MSSSTRASVRRPSDVSASFTRYTVPYLNNLYTDASDIQLGAAIIQEINRIHTPIAYYSKKLHKAQRNYTTTEKELLAIIMVLWAYTKMLSGAIELSSTQIIKT